MPKLGKLNHFILIIIGWITRRF